MLVLSPLDSGPDIATLAQANTSLPFVMSLILQLQTSIAFIYFFQDYQIFTRSSGFRYKAFSGLTSNASYHSGTLRTAPFARNIDGE